MTVPRHDPLKRHYRLLPNYLEAWAALVTAVAVLISAVTALLMALGH